MINDGLPLQSSIQKESLPRLHCLSYSNAKKRGKILSLSERERACRPFWGIICLSAAVTTRIWRLMHFWRVRLGSCSVAQLVSCSVSHSLGCISIRGRLRFFLNIFFLKLPNSFVLTREFKLIIVFSPLSPGRHLNDIYLPHKPRKVMFASRTSVRGIRH